VRLNLRPAEKEYSQQGEEIGSHVGQIVEHGAKPGLQLKNAGNVPVQNVANQAYTQENDEPFSIICQPQCQNDREDDQPVKIDCIWHIQDIFPF